MIIKSWNRCFGSYTSQKNKSNKNKKSRINLTKQNIVIVMAQHCINAINSVVVLSPEIFNTQICVWIRIPKRKSSEKKEIIGRTLANARRIDDVNQINWYFLCIETQERNRNKRQNHHINDNIYT